MNARGAQAPRVRRSRRRTAVGLLAAAGVAALTAGFLPSAGGATTPATGSAGVARKVFLDATDNAGRVALLAAGARQVFDYGSFSMWSVPASRQSAVLTAAKASPGISVRADLDVMNLRGLSIDTATGELPSVPATLAQSSTSDGLALIQFVGPPEPSWLADVEALGATIVMPVPSNGYVVYGSRKALDAVAATATPGSAMQWTGAFHPLYRLAPELRPGQLPTSGTISVNVQLVAGAKADLATVLAAGKPIRGATDLLGITTVSVTIPVSAVNRLAALGSVVNVERYSAPQLRDERQDQILAGNTTVTGGNLVPSGTGYLSWLTSKGVSTNSANQPRVAVVDDGVDNGTATPIHADFYTKGDKTLASRLTSNVNCTANPNAQGTDGHGNLNSGIVGGYNSRSGTAFTDVGGYHYGLGVNPFVRLGNIKIFADGGTFDLSACSNTLATVVSKAYAMGANITSNSWGENTAGGYNSDSQAYDALTRDASSMTAGNQQMLHVFAAGNAGPGVSTVGSPGTAKNVLTVGATENVRDDGTVDGCGISAANNAADMASFSSRGPTADKRNKPDIVAPGTHVSGPASQAVGYNGTGVCGASTGPYYPLGQTLYTWSTGTSHSTPAVAGAAALAFEYYKRVLAPGVSPSPAMTKALLLNTPTYLSGLDAGGTLPGIGQGWGGASLKTLYSGSRIVADQKQVFTAPGQQSLRTVTVTSTTKPVRVTLVWTDAAGSTVGNSYVNDLDLTVTAGGKQYLGNVFSGQYSATGGSPDPRNNVEQVWLPAGVSGPVTISVKARTLAGDGVPGNASSLDQDFALTASNVTASAPTANPAIKTITFSDSGIGNGNGFADPNENLKIPVQITNAGNATSVAGTVTMTRISGPVTVTAGTVSTAPVTAGGVLAVPGLTVHVGSTASCGASFTVQVTWTVAAATASQQLTVVLGGTTFNSYSSADVPKSIPDNDPVGATSNLTIAAGPTLGIVKVTVNITHTWDGDLTLSLIHPDGTAVTLSARVGNSGDNYTGTVFSDSATTAIGVGSPPYTGVFTPQSPLAALSGKARAGVWGLKVTDGASADVGTITGWSLQLGQPVCSAIP